MLSRTCRREPNPRYHANFVLFFGFLCALRAARAWVGSSRGVDWSVMFFMIIISAAASLLHSSTACSMVVEVASATNFSIEEADTLRLVFVGSRRNLRGSWRVVILNHHATRTAYVMMSPVQEARCINRSINIHGRPGLYLTKQFYKRRPFPPFPPLLDVSYFEWPAFSISRILVYHFGFRKKNKFISNYLT